MTSQSFISLETWNFKPIEFFLLPVNCSLNNPIILSSYTLSFCLLLHKIIVTSHAIDSHMPRVQKIHTRSHVSRCFVQVDQIFSLITTVDTRYNATRVPVHEHSRARPRDYIGVRTVGRWDERERIVVRIPRLPTELIGCSSERGRRAERENGKDRRYERRWNTETTQKCASETEEEAVEWRDRIRRRQWEISLGRCRKMKGEGYKKRVRRVEAAQTKRRRVRPSKREYV